jgi:SAM-dependent MidA family methyltransferase
MIDAVLSTASLSERLRERIERDGPVTFRDWMNSALYDPVGGYYCRADRNAWGRDGDYRTSPELTSLFAATFANYFAQLYQALGSPAEWQVLESGAGAGYFAFDLLTGLQRDFPAAFGAASYLIDETSPQSRTLIRERLRSFPKPIEFVDRQQLSLDAGIVFANELLDAFPVHRVVKRENLYREFYVSVDSGGEFQWLESELSPALRAGLSEYFDAAGAEPLEGAVVEVNLEIEEWFRQVAATLHRGFLILVDYGASADELLSERAQPEGTLRGFRQHKFVANVLANPGEHDLTATVNWTLVKTIAARVGFELVEFARQDQFLLANGLLDQLKSQSAQTASEVERLKLSSAAREMILPNGMASHFQVMVLKRD